MIELICGKCGCVFLARVVEGQTKCPECGSDDTYIAIYNEAIKDYEKGRKV